MDYARMFDLTGKKAMVVGGASGIGREVAKALSAHGADVTVADVTVAEVTAADGDLGDVATTITLDVLDTAAIESTAAAHPDVDILVFTPATNVRKRMVDYTPAEVDRVFDLNLKAAFHLIRCFGAHMAERGGGSIIGLSSVRSVVVEPGQSAYAATKAGLVQLLRTAAAELGPNGVRCNAIAPGVVRTPLTDQIRANPEWDQAYANKSALRRWAEPSEMAGAAVYLASNAASFVTGSVLFVDGGWTAVDGRYEPPR